MVLAVPGRTPFVGRERERARLWLLLEGAAHGRGRLALVSGEAGVGKTRLTQETAAEARARGVQVLAGRGYETGGQPPFIMFVELVEAALRDAEPNSFAKAVEGVGAELARLVPALRAAVPGLSQPLRLPREQQRRQLFNATASFLERLATDQPMLLVLDDLQWADTSSVSLLEHLAHRLPTTRIAVVATYRSGEPRTELVAQVASSLLRQRLAEPVELGCFDDSGVHAMLAALSGEQPPAGVVAAVHELTGGNPFFIEEVVRSLAPSGGAPAAAEPWMRSALEPLQLPGSLRSAIDDRLVGLSKAAQEVLTTAALVDGDFGIELLSAALEVSESTVVAAVAEAQKRQIVHAVAERRGYYRFGHALIRHGLLTRLGPGAERRLHARLADGLEDIHATDLDGHAAEIAHHLVASGDLVDSQRTLAFLARAADRAMAASGFGEAEAHIVAALPLCRPGLQRDRLLWQLGRARQSLGRFEAALESWGEALTGLRAHADPEEAGELCWELADLLGWMGRGAEIPGVVGDVLAAMGERASPAQVRLLCIRGVALGWGGMHADAASELERSLAAARRLGSEELLGVALHSRSLGHWFFAEHAAAAATGTEAAALLERAESPYEEANALGFAQSALLMAGRLAEAEDVDGRLVEVAQTSGNVNGLLMGRRHAALLAFFRSGELDAFEAFAHQHLEECSRASVPWVSDCHTWLAWCALLRGEPDAARSHSDDAVRLEASGPRFGASRGFDLLLRARTGCRDEFIRHLDAHRALLPGSGRPNPLGSSTALLGAVDGAVRVGERRLAAELYASVKELLANGFQLGFLDGRCVEAVAGAAAAPTNWEQAEAHFQAAEALCEELGLRLQLVDVLVLRAIALLQRTPAAPEEASRVAVRAAALAADLALPGLEADARSLTTRSRDQAASPLTRRELEVAQQVAQGLSNREIAAALHVSERTAENHVEHILRKLGFRSRTQIAAWAARLEA